MTVPVSNCVPAPPNAKKKEMTAAEYLAAKRRMLEPDITMACTVPCGECPFYEDNNGKHMGCALFELTYPEEVIAIVQKWADEHPVKTRMNDFFEKHPNATKRAEDGRPIVCAFHVGYESRERCEPTENCWECWNRPLEVDR